MKSVISAGLLACGWALAALSAAADPASSAGTPPPQSVSLAANVAGGAELSNRAGVPFGRQSSGGADFSLLERSPLGGSWYWGWGVGADAYAFDSPAAFPLKRLQDVAAQFSLEYFHGSEAAAYLTLHPGIYFGGHPGSDSWDVPVEAVTAIPIAAGLDGALGVSYGRLYREALPIVGIVWTVASNLRLEAVYPDPALVLTLGRDQELRLSGDLSGGGFETGPKTQRARLEYDSYRVGLTYTRRLGRELKLSATAGIELERVFDFYRIGRRLEAKHAPYAQLALEF